MKKGNLFLIIASVMLVLTCIYTWDCWNHPEATLPLWMPFSLIKIFYIVWIIAIPVFFIMGIIFKIQKK